MNDIFRTMLFLLGWALLGAGVCIGVTVIVALLILAASDARE